MTTTAVTEVSISSDALAELGDESITSLTDDNDRARLCNRIYSTQRDALLKSYLWNFAQARQTLSQLATGPAFEFTYQYQLPTDPFCLKVTDLYGTSSRWKVEGRLLLTDDNSADIKYTARVTDTAQFDLLFVKALTKLMAHTMAQAITGSTSLKDSLSKDFQLAIREARSSDAQEGSSEPFVSTILVDVR